MAAERAMRVIVTGAGGFVGRALVARLVRMGHDAVGIDAAPSAHCTIVGDLCDPAIVTRAFANGCDAVVHLATVPGGAAEHDPVGARRTNIDASMVLTEAAAQCGTRPRFLFASSIAVLGAAPPPGVDDATPLAPTMLYGAHKAMIERWIATLSRRGDVDGLSLRLPGIVARPPSPSGMTSAFMSDLFHALRSGTPFVAPVSPAATMWLMSVETVAAAFARALTLSAALPDDRAVTLPALRVTMSDLVATVAHRTDADPGLVTYRPDSAIEAAFGAQPPLATPRGDALGFRHDGSVDRLVAAALATIEATEGTPS